MFGVADLTQIRTGHLFKPGQTGNPGGRPKIDSKVRKLAQEHTEKAIEALVEALEATKTVVVGKGENAHAVEAPDHASRIYAANSILDRGYGKPTQDVIIARQEYGEMIADLEQKTTEQLVQIALGKE